MQENINTTQNMHENEKKKKFISTRLRDAPPDLFDPNEPRIGRRESEPHSAEVTYLFDILKTNFPKDRSIWDLHHYFTYEKDELDIQFDVSYFRDLKIDYSLSSYRASKFKDRIPNFAINILSKSTWTADVGLHSDICRVLKIPVYIIFCPYHVASMIYKPPFVRAYILQPDGYYKIHELRKTMTIENTDSINSDQIIDLKSIVPFNIGLIKLKKVHEGKLPLYRMVLLNQKNNNIYLTKMEIEKIRADKAVKRADKAVKRADKAVERADKADKKAANLESIIDKYKEKFGNI